MGDYSIVQVASEALKALLEAHITKSTEPEFKDVPITLQSPKEVRENKLTLGVSPWLYRLTLGELARNWPPEHTPEGVSPSAQTEPALHGDAGRQRAKGTAPAAGPGVAGFRQ